MVVFPAAPAVNEEFIIGNITYIWDGVAWIFKVTNVDWLDADFGTLGDIYYHNGTSFVRLAAGTQNQVLTMGAGGVPEWRDPLIN